jgi:hypothetical protein
MPQCGVAKQRANRDKPGIAGTNAVAAVVFAMIEECTDQRGVEIADIQLRGFGVEALAREAHQQSQCVSVGCDGVGTGLTLPDEPIGKKRLQRRRECTHEAPPT